MISLTCACCEKSDNCFCATIGSVALTDIRIGDAETYVNIFSTPDVYRTTLRIPYPYSIEHAYEWIEHCKKEYLSRQVYWNFAIRRLDTDLVIGGIGMVLVNPGVAEVGYWLSPTYWGMGIMSVCLRKLKEIVLNNEVYGIHTLQACIFEHNDASARVLEKCGFRYIGIVPDCYEKDGKRIAAKHYVFGCGTPNFCGC